MSDELKGTIPAANEAELSRNLESEYAAMKARFDASGGPSEAWQCARRMSLIRIATHYRRRVAELEAALAPFADFYAAVGDEIAADLLPHYRRAAEVLGR